MRQNAEMRDLRFWRNGVARPKRSLLRLAMLVPMLGGLLAGCANDGGAGLFQSNAGRAESAAALAKPPLTRTRFATRSFDIAGYYRQTAPNDPRLAVFIEGDGIAYITSGQRSIDPTPDKPVALDLAARDNAPNLLYLARPCQYTGGQRARNCDSAYWTTHRFAPEAVAAINEALDQYLRQFGPKRITFYGYSGGALVAFLLAGQRQDVDAVITISGLLDHQAWTQHFGDTPLYGSRNSLEVVDRLRSLPQRHFVGMRDDMVPLVLATTFMRRLGLAPERFITALPNADHNCCWASLWPQLSQMPPIVP